MWQPRTKTPLIQCPELLHDSNSDGLWLVVTSVSWALIGPYLGRPVCPDLTRSLLLPLFRFSLTPLSAVAQAGLLLVWRTRDSGHEPLMLAPKLQTREMSPWWQDELEHLKFWSINLIRLSNWCLPQMAQLLLYSLRMARLVYNTLKEAVNLYSPLWQTSLCQI